MSALVKRSFSVAGHRTSVALEPEFWEVLGHCAQRRAVSLARLVMEVDAERSPSRPLASALRVFALNSLLSDAGSPVVNSLETSSGL